MAQSYPTKPVRFIVGFPAQGPNDVLARLMAEWLSAKLGQPFVVENQPGKAGNIATENVVRSPADGYTILLCGPANAIGASLYPNLPFNFLRDFTPVGGITREALVMVVNPSLPVNNAAEYLAYAKANPGKLKMASTGNGSAPHVTAGRITATTDYAHLPFPSWGPVAAEIMNGRSNYYGWENTFTKRFSNHWQANATYTLSKFFDIKASFTRGELAPAFQFVRSPLCEGSSDVRLDTGVVRFHEPLTVRLYADPDRDCGGARSNDPSSEPWSLRRCVAGVPTDDGMPSCRRIPSRRATESAAMPFV